MSKNPDTYNNLTVCPDWLGEIGDIPDHYHGFNWSSGVMPNNILFFLRQDVEEMKPEGVTHCLHYRYEMVIAYEGTGLACIDDLIYHIKPGDAILLAPRTFHRYFDFKEEGFTWLFCTFELETELGDVSKLKIPRELSGSDLEEISEAGRLYINPGIDESLTFEIGLKLGRMVQKWKQRPQLYPIDQPAPHSTEACDLLRTLTNFVNEKMDQAIRIDDLAKHIGRSSSYLRKTFRDFFGISLGRFLQKSRLTRSFRLIDANDQSISQIAHSCGFESIHSFSQSFKRAIGMSPTAYRDYLSNKKPPIKVPLKSRPRIKTEKATSK
jgi:AraC-like DNA-binding protein